MSDQNERPRVRWAAIVWGVVFAAVAVAGLWFVLDPERYAAFTEAVLAWALAADAVTIAVVVILVIGAAVLLAGLAAGLRRLQTPTSRSQAPVSGVSLDSLVDEEDPVDSP
ncbi:MAG: hypothetical protein QM607_00075 [Microbacterium sp.]